MGSVQKASKKRNVEKDLKSTYQGAKYDGNQYDHKASWRSHLQQHIKSVHEVEKYDFDQCDYKSSRKNHIQTFNLKSMTEINVIIKSRTKVIFSDI